MIIQAKNKHQQCGLPLQENTNQVWKLLFTQNGKSGLSEVTTFNVKQRYSKDKLYCSDDWANLLKQIDQCRSNSKTHSNPYGNVDRAQIMEQVFICFNLILIKFQKLIYSIDRIYKQCMLPRFYNLSKYARLSLSYYSFSNCVFSSAATSVIKNVFRVVKAKFIFLPSSIKGVQFFKFILYNKISSEVVFS